MAAVKFDKLITLLKELFQLDQPDLDFGLYRIMHAKSGEITQFLEKDLLPQVQAAFGEYQTADKAELEKELAKVIAGVEAAGMSPDEAPKVKELKAKLTDEAVDLDGLESEVYDHLYSFFRRYYHEGDFLSKRVYKPGVYSIPYEGEEVKLHWANKDQYYIKTSEYLRDYAFRLRPGDDGNPMRVHFKLVDASEGEHGNAKASEGKDRVFVLASSGDSGHDFLSIENGELSIAFEYRPATMEDWVAETKADATAAAKKKPPVQSALLDQAAKAILEVTHTDFMEWISELDHKHVKTDGAKADYSRLAAHLRRYSARNTFDYFIHKDLAGFLKQEIDFYIKNEVMHLDDIENESVARADQYLSKIKAIRKIAGKIIAFLTQLEDFQKKLWLKKKFVIDTNYCITLDRIPDEFYPEIIANDAQREEWVRLFAIDKIETSETTIAYSSPLTQNFLKTNCGLVVDTTLFDQDFKCRLIEKLPSIDSESTGTLVHGDNYHTLLLLQRRWAKMLDCIYIDPPYNTDATPIIYKNGYKASTWTQMMYDRTSASKPLLKESGVLVAAIDDEQQRELSFILDEAFDRKLLGTIVVRSNPSGRPSQTGYSVSHEYMIFVGASNLSHIGRLPPSEQQAARFNQSDDNGQFEWRNLRREGSNSDRTARRALYYPIYIKGDLMRVPSMEWDPSREEWIILEEPASGETTAWPTNEQGDEKTWRWEHNKVTRDMEHLAVRKDRSGKDYVYYKRRPHDEGVVSVSSWFDAKYSATEHGSALLKKLFGRNPFSYPKSIHAVNDAVYISGGRDKNSIVLDYFAGSGTTGHAVMNLNREDGGKRKFILSEVSTYFDSILVPRLKKASYCNDWEDGLPKNRSTGLSQCIKIIRLESYEDALNNLEHHRNDTQQDLLTATASQGQGGLKEQYMLRYMLNVETRESASLLNIKAFNDPTSYKLRVKRPGGDESKEVNVDLLETFNYLIGLTVEHIAAPQVFTAEFETDTEQRLKIKGRLKQDAGGPYWFRTVTGRNPDGQKTLIIWRKLTGNVEEDNAVLEEWFTKQGYSTKDSEFQLIYVNGDCTLENLKTAEDTWKVRLLEEDFHRLMFDTEGL